MRRLVPAAVAAALVAAVLVSASAPRALAPEEPLERLLAARALPPEAAARELERLGPVPGWERERFRWWFEALRRAGAEAAAWRRYLAAAPPASLARAAEREAWRAALAGGEPGAVAGLERLMEAGDAAAAELLVREAGGTARRRAAAWLAVHRPERLRRLDPALDRRLLRRLSPAMRLERARAWARAGRRRRAVRELNAVARRVPDRLRLVLARAWLEAGRPRRALRVLPRRPPGAVAELAARAWRAVAWDRYPGRGAEAAFGRCADAARTAGEGAAVLELECATEAGRLEQAWAAWRRLAAGGWSGPRRAWLGRRLGVALALAGRTRRADRLALELPGQRRCLGYWVAVADGDTRELRRLAGRPVADLYALWARAATGAVPASLPPAPPSPGPRVPAAVRWIAARGDPAVARTWWWRAVRVRGALAGESLELARREAAAGRRQAAVRALRAGWPDLDRAEPWRLPREVVELYLPLPWRREVEAAAAEAGLPPWVLAAVVRQESAFEPGARSAAGAVGLAQLRPATARRHARRLGLGSGADLHDPVTSLRLGAAELARLRARLGSPEAALAAYNAGEARVRRWLRGRDPGQRWVESIPVPETYRYVRRVAYLAEAYRVLRWRAGEVDGWWNSR